MRILIDGRHLTRPPYSGVGEYTTQLLRALFSISTQDTFTILTTGRARLPDGLLGPLPQNVSVRHVPVPNRLLTLSMAAAGKPTLDALAVRPAAGQARGPAPTETARFDVAFMPNLAVGAPSARVPYVVMLHDLSWKLFPTFYPARMRLWHHLVRPARLLGGAAAVLTPSAHAARDAARLLGLPPERLRAMPHGVNPAFQPRALPTDSGVRSRLRLPRRFALSVGSLEPRKNLVAAVDAVAAYRARTRDDLRFVLAGPRGWNTDALEARLRRADARAFARRLGPVSRDDLAALYRMADVLLWPSIYEGFGLPVLEAMASGLPVITSHASSLPELALDAAVLVNPFDQAEIAAALEEVMGSDALRARMRTRGLARAAAFTWESSARATLAALREAAQAS